MLVWYRFFSSVLFSVLKPRFLRFCGTGSGAWVLVPIILNFMFSVQGFQGVLYISQFGTASVPFRFRLGSKSGGT